MDQEWGTVDEAYYKTKMNLINLSATLNMHNYLFKNIFKVLAKFICTYVCYTSASFFSFYISGSRSNNKAWYIKIAFCINISPLQCSLDFKKFVIPNFNQMHNITDHFSTKCLILF